MGQRRRKLTVHLEPEDTAGLAGRYVYDLWVVDDDDRRFPAVLPSLLEVERGVVAIPEPDPE